MRRALEREDGARLGREPEDERGLAVIDTVSVSTGGIFASLAFASFVLGEQRLLKLFGLGLASAIFIDATLVRIVLVPATMELLGDRNWWFPRWLDRIVPRLHVEAVQKDNA